MANPQAERREMTTETARELPYIILEVEDRLLGALMYQWMDHWENVPELRLLKPSDFVRERNQWVFEMILHMRAEGMHPNYLSVAYCIARLWPKRFEAGKIADYLNGLVHELRYEPLLSTDVRQWAKDVRQAAKERHEDYRRPIRGAELP